MTRAMQRRMAGPVAVAVAGTSLWWVSRADLEDRVLRAATGLRALGVEAGDAVALLLRNDFAFFEASYAAVAIGAYAVPVNWHLTAPEVATLYFNSSDRIRTVQHQHPDPVPRSLFQNIGHRGRISIETRSYILQIDNQ